MYICIDLEDQNDNNNNTNEKTKTTTKSKRKTTTKSPKTKGLSKKQQIARERTRDHKGQFVRKDGTNKSSTKQSKRGPKKRTNSSKGMFAFGFNSFLSLYLFVYVCNLC